MASYSYEDINAYRQGNSTYDFGKAAASEVRDFACGLYKNYQGWALTQLLPSNPFSDLTSGIWDSICTYPANPGLPPVAPVPPFVGGQCAAPYAVNFRFRTLNPPGNPSFGGIFETGPIVGVRKKYGPNPQAAIG